eukprot:2464457-Amphidinium_carterae.1
MRYDAHKRCILRVGVAIVWSFARSLAMGGCYSSSYCFSVFRAACFAKDVKEGKLMLVLHTSFKQRSGKHDQSNRVAVGDARITRMCKDGVASNSSRPLLATCWHERIEMCNGLRCTSVAFVGTVQTSRVCNCMDWPVRGMPMFVSEQCTEDTTRGYMCGPIPGAAT